jgi:hypothetical protein
MRPHRAAREASANTATLEAWRMLMKVKGSAWGAASPATMKPVAQMKTNE